MTVAHDTLDFLFSETGRAALDWLAACDLDESRTLSLLETLRRDLTPEQASAALTLARLRVRAAAKFTRADQMFFTPDALEQASSEVIGTWRARRFWSAGFTRIVDLGCGIGGDAVALSGQTGAEVLAVDRDLLRLRLARANLAVYERRGAHVVQADLTDSLPVGKTCPAAFFDPARRADGRRIFSVRHTIPPLDVIKGWDFKALAVKLSPGVKLAELEPYLRAGASVEFVSLGGDLKEAVLWQGFFAAGARIASRVELDGRGCVMVPDRRAQPLELSAPRAVLYEPDPALMRAGLFNELGAQLGVPLYLLDEQIAYLTANSYVISPWLRAWPVLAWMPFNLKKLRAALRARGIGRVTVKKRGSPLTPEELIGRLKLGGDGDSVVVVLTQIAGQHSVILCGEMIVPAGGAERGS
jgi:SAM-dependent methyltransferase